jgi:hypothetical protein
VKGARRHRNAPDISLSSAPATNPTVVGAAPCQQPATTLSRGAPQTAQRRSRNVRIELKLSLVTSPSYHILMRDQALNRRQARRLSRRFSGVGVAIPATRLQQLQAGASAGDDELTDVEFAIAATEIQHEQRLAALKRSRRRAVHWLIVAGLVLLSLHSLLCMVYLLSLVLHTTPY